jgi:hypothetical protein
MLPRPQDQAAHFGLREASCGLRGGKLGLCQDALSLDLSHPPCRYNRVGSCIQGRTVLCESLIAVRLASAG